AGGHPDSDETKRALRHTSRVKTAGIMGGAMQRERYTHGHPDAVLRSHRWRTAENSAGYLLAELRPGTSVLDVGCGPGTVTADFTRRVAPGAVVGIDASADVVAVAARGHQAPNPSFRAGGVYRLAVRERALA